MRAKEPLTGRKYGDTRQNLSLTAQFEGAGPAELDEHARTARNEGFMDIASWFESVARLREAHAARLADVLARLEGGRS